MGKPLYFFTQRRSSDITQHNIQTFYAYKMVEPVKRFHAIVYNCIGIQLTFKWYLKLIAENDNN